MDTSGQAPRAAVAAFDVDGTLTRRDSFVPFLLRTAPTRLLLTPARQPRRLARALVHRDRNALKELVCATLAGTAEAVLRERGSAYAHSLHERRLREDTVARLRRHQQLGHTVVLVSASLDAYIEPLGELLGVDGVLCTRLAAGPEGRLSGALAGANCSGPEKAARLREWLEGQGLAGAELWAYGDSSGDDDLLAMADHPVRVRGVRIDLEPDPA